MIPAGYMAKQISPVTDWLKNTNVKDIYSVSGCISEDFFNDYIQHWKHNGFWLFDSPQIIREVAQAANVDLAGMRFFYYEVHDREFSNEGKDIRPVVADAGAGPVNNVQPPKTKMLEGFDIVQWITNPSCSPLTCNGLAAQCKVNEHALFDTMEEALQQLENGLFLKGEPGPLRIAAVYSLETSQ